jgi:hypothetical protein
MQDGVYSRTKEWVFGCKLYLPSTTTAAAAGDLVVPLTAYVTIANVPDNKMSVLLTSSIFVLSLPTLSYMTADPEYDDKELYEYHKKIIGINLICPVERHKSSSKKRLDLVYFYESILEQQAI